MIPAFGTPLQIEDHIVVWAGIPFPVKGGQEPGVRGEILSDGFSLDTRQLLFKNRLVPGVVVHAIGGGKSDCLGGLSRPFKPF